MFEYIRANQRRSAFLIGFMAVILMAVGYGLAEYLAPGAGPFGVVLAFIVWVILSLLSYYKGGKILLAMSGARRIQKQDHPVLFNVVEEMCVASGLASIPEIYIIDDDAPNAFATGRDPQHSAVAVTSGMLKLLSRDELQGVIGHEIGHVNNRDTLLMMVLGVMLGTIVFLAEIGTRMMRHGSITRTGGRRSSNGGGQLQIILFIVSIVLMILAPILARLIYLAISRRREYLADASGAQYTRYPEGLAGALEKLGTSTQRLQASSAVLAPMYIVNPMNVSARGLADLSTTHPPLSQRVKILRSMGGTAGFTSYNEAFRKVTGRPVGVVPLVAVQSTRDTPVRKPAVVPDPLAHIERVRATTDLLWHLQNFIFIACACGTNLKIPPEHTGKRIECPHCARVHSAQPSTAS